MAAPGNTMKTGDARQWNHFMPRVKTGPVAGDTKPQTSTNKWAEARALVCRALETTQVTR